MTFSGDRLNEHRVRRGLSRPRLADAAGCSDRFIEMLEKGQRSEPGANMLARLAAALDVEMEALFR